MSPSDGTQSREKLQFQMFFSENLQNQMTFKSQLSAALRGPHGEAGFIVLYCFDYRGEMTAQRKALKYME